MTARSVFLLTLLLALSLEALTFAQGQQPGHFAHGDSLPVLLLSLSVILVSAKIGGELAVRAGQPAVLGELLAGIVLGNMGLAGVHAIEPLKSDPTLALLAGLGVLLLLFEVGLGSTVGEMLAVGPSALLVAALGVVTPFILGWLVSAWLLPEANGYVHAFVGATLCATSVGITARVLQDLNASRTPEARIILGAAVIDDVLGLVILTGVGGVIAAAAGGTQVSVGSIAWTGAKATLFLVGSLVIGVSIAPRTFAAAAMLKSRGVLLSLGLSFCFCLAWLANAIDLAPIVGAFAAGLILEDVFYRDFVSRGERPLEDLVHPITDFLAPVFFVLMGMRTDLRILADPAAIGSAAALTVVAIIGKQACSLGAFGHGVSRRTVGIGMIPRGEVGLIFANVGTELRVNGAPVIGSATFAAVVIVVIVTTLITPPALRWSFARQRTHRSR